MSKNVLENWETKQAPQRPDSSEIHKQNVQEAKFCPQQQMCTNALTSEGDV